MGNREDIQILFYVCVPVYKVEKYIDACIQSVLNQSYQNFRLVLVDDGSPDQSGEICEKYAEKDKRIKVIHQKNTGLVAARQTAIRYVRQQAGHDRIFIIYLDSDDSLKNDALRLIHQSIVSTNCDLLVFGMDRVKDGRIVTPFDKTRHFVGTITDKRELYNLVLNNWDYNPLCRKAVDFSIYEEEDYSKYAHILQTEDLLQSLSLYRNCKKAVFIEEALYNYTINSASITQSVNPDNFKMDSTVRREVLNFIRKEGVQNEADVETYLGYCRGLLNDSVRTISLFSLAFSKKVRFFDKILEDDYYRMLLNHQMNRKISLCLLRKKHYHTVILFNKVKYGLHCLLRKMRKKRG